VLLCGENSLLHQSEQSTTKFIQVHPGTSRFVHPSFLHSVPLSCPQSGDPAKLFPGYDVDSATSSFDTEIDSGC